MTTKPGPIKHIKAKPTCGAFNGYICTLERGHDGDHEAHGTTSTMYLSWPKGGER